MMHSVAVKAELPHTKTAPPDEAEFEVMVQLVAVILEPPLAKTAPPLLNAVFEIIVQSVVVTVDS